MKKSLKVILCVALIIFTLSTACVGAFAYTVRTTCPTSDNPYYTSLNPFSWGQCTWYAYGRVYEMTGVQPKISHGSASDWWANNKANGYYAYGNEPALGAIVCYSGHVAVVEKIENGVAIVSEGNYSHQDFKYGRSATNLNQTLYGYIYAVAVPGSYTVPVDDPVTPDTPVVDKNIKVSFSAPEKSAIAKDYEIGANDATLVTTVKVEGTASFKSAGIRLYNESGVLQGTKTITTSIETGTEEFDLKCCISDDMGQTLENNTTYKYRFVVNANTNTYYSDYYTFTTGASKELESITLSSTALTLKVGNTKQLTAKAAPTGAALNKSWETTNAKVADVDANGNVTALGAGSCTIICTDSKTGISAKCSVTVKDSATGGSGTSSGNEGENPAEPSVPGTTDGKDTADNSTNFLSTILALFAKFSVVLVALFAKLF